MNDLQSSGIRGQIGERCTARYLRDNGYEIIGANYHTRFGEIDIIATKGKYIAFVEVKARGQKSKATPAEAVDANKQEKLRKTTLIYLSKNETQLQPRFDVVEVILNSNEELVSINHIENAFE
ncbi:MAG: YraN family protein [Clostridia bacterium]|nr:YraN family protein [Clostridia bacterium]